MSDPLSPTPPPSTHSASSPDAAPASPRSDPEEKLGRRPDVQTLAEEAELQRDGTAAQGSVRNANLPRPNETGHDPARDPEAERRVPGRPG